MPLYHQTEKIIVDRISAEGVVGCRLPREMDLLKIFGVSANEDFCGSLYAVLEQKCGVPIEWAEEQISASRATPEEARHLGIQGDDVVPVMERHAFTHGNQPLEFVRAFYRPEHYTFSIRLKR